MGRDKQGSFISAMLQLYQQQRSGPGYRRDSLLCHELCSAGDCPWNQAELGIAGLRDNFLG